MIYHKFYGWDDERVLSATKEGVRALKAADTGGYLCSGLFVGHVPPERLQEFIQYTAEGGSRGICFFSVQEIDRIPGYWEAIRKRFGAQQHTNL